MVKIAEVDGKYLYLSDLHGIFPQNISKADSINFAKSYIDNWIKNQLLLKKAEINLSKEQLDISKQLEAYRTSLLIYKYEEQMVREKIDTVVTQDEIEKYYNDNTSNFILDDNLIKALFIKVPLTAASLNDLKKWYKSDQSEDIKNLDKYCVANATKYSYFNDDWINFNTLVQLLPQSIANEEQFLQEQKTIEAQDNEFLYLVSIKDFKLKGAVAPLGYVKRKVKDIIINKRKVNFISELEKNIYNDAADHNNFRIYNLEKQ